MTGPFTAPVRQPSADLLASITAESAWHSMPVDPERMNDLGEVLNRLHELLPPFDINDLEHPWLGDPDGGTSTYAARRDGGTVEEPIIDVTPDPAVASVFPGTDARRRVPDGTIRDYRFARDPEGRPFVAIHLTLGRDGERHQRYPLVADQNGEQLDFPGGTGHTTTPLGPLTMGQWEQMYDAVVGAIAAIETSGARAVAQTERPTTTRDRLLGELVARHRVGLRGIDRTGLRDQGL
ncbi:MAG TPA: hypothetical protein VLE99_03380 [Candidatus Saccharimonadales bacterium]|nr:hypothetical protein [Candidatus Saccharimonadales bacterium]